MTAELRPALGSFMHAVCFQYLRLYTEEIAGRAPIIAAGRKRGLDVIELSGLLGSSSDAAQIQRSIGAILGAEGTRLCLLQSVTARPEGGYEIRLTESACTAGQRASEPMCAYTLGVFIGAVQGLTGQRMQGRETSCEACGDSICTYIIEPV